MPGDIAEQNRKAAVVDAEIVVIIAAEIGHWHAAAKNVEAAGSDGAGWHQAALHYAGERKLFEFGDAAIEYAAHFAEFVVSEIWQFESEVALFDSFSGGLQVSERHGETVCEQQGQADQNYKRGQSRVDDELTFHTYRCVDTCYRVHRDETEMIDQVALVAGVNPVFSSIGAALWFERRMRAEAGKEVAQFWFMAIALVERKYVVFVEEKDAQTCFVAAQIVGVANCECSTDLVRSIAGCEEKVGDSRII